ncbi:hypothetical protein [Trinickia acidisoli]|uniref:hypothetical protein n=1 Tax=Trinickia acidisoli TaxID=2767482 RepID=UPI001A908F67|nr:hypothetical protein [Trinickia acidisoli]
MRDVEDAVSRLGGLDCRDRIGRVDNALCDSLDGIGRHMVCHVVPIHPSTLDLGALGDDLLVANVLPQCCCNLTCAVDANALRELGGRDAGMHLDKFDHLRALAKDLPFRCHPAYLLVVKESPDRMDRAGDRIFFGERRVMDYFDDTCVLIERINLQVNVSRSGSPREGEV